MHRQSLKSLLLSSTLAARPRLRAARPARRTRWRTRWSRPTRPARCWSRPARRCAASTRPCRRRAPTGGRRSAPRRLATTQTDARGDRGPARQHAQAALNASLLVFDNGDDQGGDRVGAQPDRRRPRRPQGRRAAGALQRGAGLRRRAPRPGVRAPGQQRRRAPGRDAGRDPEPLRGRRGDPHRRQPEPVAPRRLALDPGGGPGPARDLARGLPRRGRRAADNLEPLPPLPQVPTIARRGDRDRGPAQPADHLGPVQRAGRGLRLRPGARRQGAAGRDHRLGRLRARQRPVRRLGRQHLRRGRHRRARCRSTPAGATTAWCARRRRCSTSAASSCRTTARAVTQAVGEAWAQLDVARASIVARREQVEAARIAAEGVAEEARLGARSTLDVLDADQERLTAEAEVVRALRDEYVATYGLLRAMGLLDGRAPEARHRDLRPRRQLHPGAGGPAGGYDTSAVDRIRARWEQHVGDAAGTRRRHGTRRPREASRWPRCWPRSGRWSRPRPRRGWPGPARARRC